MKDINIVFLNYYTKDDILRAIESILQDTKQSSFSSQITVADNSQNSDHIKEALQSSFPNVLYVDCGANVGFGKGNTIGLQAVEARYYCILNRDIVIPPNSRTIERMIRFMDAHPKIGCIGPKLLNMDGSLQYSCYRFDPKSIMVKPFRHLQWDEKYAWTKKYADKLLMKDFDHQKTRPVDWVLGAAMMVRREVIDTVGWFDPQYFMYMEDCDWCRAMWEAGWPVYYVHDITIHHAHARDSAKVPGLKALLKNRLARIHLKSWIQFLWKWRKSHKYYRF
ncbi:MAG TPA: glycosyltransferase family 2 protein [Candidatus Kapabacteria bacterium]|nr:glycosyltransferase family 2 protein [Candidatus Kapabacteria bacterium]